MKKREREKKGKKRWESTGVSSQSGKTRQIAQ